jgi:RND family efflux transporter MFP subunit
VALLSATVFQALQASAPAPRPAAPARALSRTLAAEGRVVAYPGAEVSVSAERAGRLVRVLVTESQAVKAGQLLAEIEADELRASLDEARARVREAEAELRLAELNERRRRELVREEVVAVHDLDQATRDREIGAARLETARAEVARLEAQLRKSRILAPIAGTVTLRSVDAGEMVEAGTPVVTLADLSRLRVEGEADEADAARLREGAPVLISAQGRAGQQWQGVVEEVASSATLRRLKPQDPSRPTDTRIVAVKVAFAGPAPLKLGTTVDLGIEARQ